jgi:hypothetical protein
LFSTFQVIAFIVLPSYLLIFFVGYLIARRNSGPVVTTLGLAPKILTPLAVSSVEGFKKVLALLSFLILLPLLPLFLLFSLPYLLVRARAQRRREAEFAQRMKLGGRVISWPAAWAHAGANEGTLIYEMLSFHGPSRFWWTPDDVAAISPFPFRRLTDTGRHMMENEFRPFAQWCHQRYTSEASGTALLIEQPSTKEERHSFRREAADFGYICCYHVGRESR